MFRILLSLRKSNLYPNFVYSELQPFWMTSKTKLVSLPDTFKRAFITLHSWVFSITGIWVFTTMHDTWHVPCGLVNFYRIWTKFVSICSQRMSWVFVACKSCKTLSSTQELHKDFLPFTLSKYETIECYYGTPIYSNSLDLWHSRKVYEKGIRDAIEYLFWIRVIYMEIRLSIYDEQVNKVCIVSATFLWKKSVKHPRFLLEQEVPLQRTPAQIR